MTNQNELTAEEQAALEAKREYHRNYYKKNKKKYNENAKRWRKDNPDKVAAANQRYWLKKAQEKRA